MLHEAKQLWGALRAAPRELAASLRLSKGVTIRGRRVTLRHTPPSFMSAGGEWAAPTTIEDGTSSWDALQLMASARRLDAAPSEMLLNPDLQRGLAVVTVYEPRCLPQSARTPAMGLSRGCPATPRVLERQLWSFTTAP